ncbi:MAG: hypothetical protein MJY68_03415 [Bacteroidaceae bacterium]|nr:hypothetical protein [Bacteroidaceae bacterium]
MKKIATLFIIGISTYLYSFAQDKWNAVKMFDLDTNEKVYNFYIDSVGVTNGEAVFCFQTNTEKLIKTKFNGEIIENTDNPYHFFTVLNGDTLVSSGSNIIAPNGTTLYTFYYTCEYIASSYSNAYVYLHSPNRGYSYVVNCMNGVHILKTFRLSGLCTSKNGVYMIERDDGTTGNLFYVDENNGDSIQTIHSIHEPRGIAEYRGSLYVFSLTDKALYRLELSQETAVLPIPRPNNPKYPIHYRLDGIKIEESTPGFHLVKYPDGSVKKIMIPF